MWVPIATLTPGRLQERRELLNSTFYGVGNSFVGLTKSAGSAKPTYALAGRLVGSESGWVLLKVPNALVRGAFDALHEPGIEPPEDLNAHISVMRPEELEQIGGMDKITERGHFFRYQLGQVKEVVPAGQGDMSKCWFIQVKSPELEKLRKSYGLTAKPKDNEFEFHITIAYRKKNVFREVDEGKAASFLKLPRFLAQEIERNQEKEAKHIVITGHSGAGKTELAKLIHDETGLPVKSLDKDKLWRKSHVKDDPDRYEPGTKAFDKFHRLRKKMTDHALKLKKPHILEGCQLMADPKRLEPHLSILVDTPKSKVIEQRLHRDRKDGKVERDGVSARIAKAVELFEGLNGEVSKLKKSPRVHKVRFEWKVETESKTAAEKKTCTIAVDLDGTICEWHGAHQAGVFGELREGATEVMAKWKKAGHRIIIWTSRDDMSDVRKWLAEKKVPYDEINRDSEGPPSTSPKVIAHVYVDDRGVNARRDWSYIEKMVDAQIEAGNNKIPLPMIGHYEPKQKLKRDIFLYQDPKGVDNKFAQCSTCHDYTGKSCENFAKGNTVSPTGSCGLYHFGKGSDKLLGNEMGIFTKEEAGYVERQVRCENCAFFDADEGYCELYEKLNKEWPHVFDLEEKVDKHGCCNAQVARNEKAKEAMEAIQPAMFADDLMALIARRKMKARALKPRLPVALQPPAAPVVPPVVEEKQGFDLKQTFQDPMFGVDFQGGTGKNIVDRMEEYAKQQAQWDASTIGAQGDRPVYHRTLRGLANILKLKPSDEAIHHATGDIAKVAPYATSFLPGVWDALHGPRGSTANLARNFSASGQVSPLDAAGLASNMKLGAEHGRRAVTVSNRDGDKVLCPHCSCELTDAATYKDAKGWVFCRACFRKGKGAIRMPEKQGNSPIASIIQRMFPQATGVNPVLAHLNSQHPTPRQDVTRQIGIGTKVAAPPIVGGRPAPTKVPNPELMDTVQAVYDRMLPMNPEHGQGGMLPRPFDKGAAFKVAPSQIHGQGVFTDTDMNAGDDFGLALEAIPQAKPGQPAFKRSDLGKFLNHADDANAELYSAGNGKIHVRALKPIEKANEVTVHYPSGMQTQQQVHGEKQGFSGAMGSGAESGQSVTAPPRLMDGSGATPTGAENQPVKDTVHPDEVEIAADDPMFDLSSLKVGTDNFMASAVGPNDAVGTDQGVQFTAKSHVLPAAIASAYQASGTIEAAGNSSKPTGAGVPERGGGYGSTAGPLSAPVVRDPVTEVSGSSAPMQGLPFTMGIG